MEKLLVKQLYRETEKFADKEVSISGWIRTLRSSKAFGFIEVNDGSFFKNVQIILEASLENFKELCKMPISTSGHTSAPVKGPVISPQGRYVDKSALLFLVIMFCTDFS